MIHLQYVHLCDFATTDPGQKPTVVGIFDMVYVREPSKTVKMVSTYFTTKIAASLADGSTHPVRIVVRNEDEVEVNTIDLGDLTFNPTGPGRPLVAHIVLSLAGMEFPGIGDYQFEVWVSGQRIGSTQLYVVEPPPS